LGFSRLPGSTLRVNGRDYNWPQRPLVVVCLDGSSFEYVQEAIAAGVAPYLGSLVARGLIRMADAAMPTFTNPNNVSIVTGVSPAKHGISGNFFLDPMTGRAVMMNDASFLRAETIPAAFSRAGANVVIITAKNKLKALLSAGLRGVCLSAEQEGQPVYSATLSEYVLRRGVELVRSTVPDITYLSTSDYVQHTHPPGSREANEFYMVADGYLAALDLLGVNLVVTADHGMRAKTDEHGRPRVLFLQTLLDDWLGTGATTVILPITDPYVAHHGSLGSFATIYVASGCNIPDLVRELGALGGVEIVLGREAACERFELPADRIGEVVVCADGDTVLGTRPADHGLSELRAPLRSHGGLAEREVPMLFNGPLLHVDENTRMRNYDAFWIGLNGMADCRIRRGR
jgi:phosphonoacetate hydrolase